MFPYVIVCENSIYGIGIDKCNEVLLTYIVDK